MQTDWMNDASAKATSWSQNTIAAIFLRQQRRKEGIMSEPSDEDIEECIKWHYDNSQDLYEKVTEDQVKKAFVSGAEVSAPIFFWGS